MPLLSNRLDGESHAPGAQFLLRWVRAVVGVALVNVHRPPGMSCPVCKSRSWVKQSHEVTPIVRELRYACDNVNCGATFRAELVVTHIISPSALTPAANLHLPLWRTGVANDNALVAAMDA